MFLAAANTDLDPVGSRRYRTLLHLLRLIGPAAFERLLFSDDWTFLPDQWEVQAWARIDANISRDRFWYFSPQCSEADYGIFPGSDGNHLLEPGRRYRGDKEDVQRSMDGFLARARARLAAQGNRRPRIAFLCDGPYGIVKDVSAT
jgi:hypothetical protein